MAFTETRVVAPANRTHNIKYAVRDVIQLADQARQAGKEMIYLNIGDPNIFDFAPPAHMVDAVADAMRKNYNGYSPSSGIPEAREAIEREAARKGIQSIVHTWVTSGASEAIELALNALVNPGDNVLTPSPGYPLYTAVLSKLDVENRAYYLDESNGWQPDIEDIISRIDEKTKAIVLINPNNPTGALCSTEMLKQLIQIAIDKDIILFSDEIYDKLVFEGDTHISTASLTTEAKIITFNGLSKSYVVPGFRIGWGIMSGPADELRDYSEAIQKMERARLCASHPMQYGIQPALEGPQDHLGEMMQRLTKRRDVTFERLNGIDGISCVKPKGAFYAFPRLDIGVSDTEFVERVVRETGVVIVPGSGFGQRPGTEHFRVVFLPPEDLLDKAFDRIASIVQKFKG